MRNSDGTITSLVEETKFNGKRFHSKKSYTESDSNSSSKLDIFV